MKIDKQKISRESVSGDNDSFIDAELTLGNKPLQTVSSEKARPIKADMETYQQRAWEKQENELMNEGYLNEGILARLRLYWKISEAWKIVKKLSGDRDIDIDNELIIPEVLDKAKIRRKRAHEALQHESRGNNNLEIDLDHAILDILLDQDTVEQLGKKDSAQLIVVSRKPGEPDRKFYEKVLTGTGRQIGFIERLGKPRGGSYDSVEHQESKHLIESIVHKRQKIALPKKPNTFSEASYPSIKDPGIPLCHFRKDFLTILYVLSEHSQELDFLQGKIYEDPNDVIVFAEKLYEYGRGRIEGDIDLRKDEDLLRFKRDYTPLNEIKNHPFGEWGYAHDDIGMLIRSEVQTAIQKIHEKKNRDLLNLRTERNNYLLELFHVLAALSEPVTAPQGQKKSWFPWKRKEESSHTEELLEMEKKKREIIATLQQEKYWGDKSLIPSEDDLIALAIKAQ